MHFISYVLLKALKTKIIEVLFLWDFPLAFYSRKEATLTNKGEMRIYDNPVEEKSQCACCVILWPTSHFRDTGSMNPTNVLKN